MTAHPRYPWQRSAAPATPPAPQKPPTITAAVQRVTLRPSEAAAAIGVSKATLATWERSGDGPPSFTAPDGRLRLYPVAQLVQWAADRAQDAANNQQGGAER